MEEEFKKILTGSVILNNQESSKTVQIIILKTLPKA